VINKIDLAPMVGGDRPFVFTNMKTGLGLDSVIRFIEKEGLLA